MRLRRKHNITALAMQMQRIEQALAAIEADKTFLLPPYQMQALAELRASATRTQAQISDLEPELWERVRQWKETPYTPSKRRIKRLLSFIGWWLAGFVAIDFAVMGWFTPLFPEPWYRFAASAGFSLAFTLWLCWSDKKFLGE